MDRPPVLRWRGTRPSRAPKSRPRSPRRCRWRPPRRLRSVADAGDAHEPLVVGFLLTDLVDLAGEGFDSLIEMSPVFEETHDQIAHSRRYLVLSVFQDRQKGVTQSAARVPTAMPCSIRKAWI